jgi:putative ABC transport system ATP-binding protein
MTENDEKKHLIALKDVNKAYVSSAGTFDALRNINLTVGKAEFVAIIGKSGSGKTTLMNMLAGIDKPTSGEILIDNKPIHTMDENQLAKLRGLYVGVVFQFFQLLPTLSIIENIMLPMDFCNVFTKSQRRERALELLERVGIKDQAFKFPTALSGGQQQRAAIARSWSCRAHRAVPCRQ